MRQFRFFLNVHATYRLCQNRNHSSLLSNSNSWHSVAKSVPKTYANQAQKLARSLEEKFNIAEDGTLINVKNGVKSNVRAEDLMSFYVTKKKTKLTPASLTDILEEMKTLQATPLHAHSKKIYEEAKQMTKAPTPADVDDPERATITSSESTTSKDMDEPQKPAISVVESLDEIVKEREKPRRLYYEEVTANDLSDLHEETRSFNSNQSKELETKPNTIEAEIQLTEREISKSEPSKLQLSATPEKSSEAESSKAEIVVEENLEIKEKVGSDNSSAKFEKMIKIEAKEGTNTATPDNPEFEVKTAEKSKDPVVVEAQPEPVVQPTSKGVDENSNQSKSDNLSSATTETSTDILMYSVVGLSIALGIYLFKSREKHQPSAKEIIPLPPQNGVKDDSEDLNNTQTLPQEVNDKVQELEIVHSDSFLGNSERVAELEPLKEKSQPVRLSERLHADDVTAMVVTDGSIENHEVVGDKEDKDPPRGNQLEREVKVYLVCYAIVAIYNLYYLNL